MTRDSVTRRGARSSEGSPPDPVTLVLAVILAGVALRILIAGVLLPLSGYRTDVVDFSLWAGRLASIGPGQFYAPDYFSDYPPGYLYVLWLLGSIGDALQPLIGADITRGLVKIPGILADGAVAWLLFDYSRRFLDRRIGGWPGARIGLIAAVLYLFNPGTIFDSAVWGQVDSVGTFAVLGSLWFLARGWTELSAVAAVIAFLVKFQFAFLLPVVAVVGVKRHLLGRSTDPEHDGKPDGLRVLTSLASGLGSLVVLIWPFGLSVFNAADAEHSLIGRFLDAADTYKGLAINALNLWNNPWSQLDFQRWGCDSPNNPGFCSETDGIAFLLGGFAVTWQLVGAVLFGLVVLIALWQVARRDDPVGILRGALLLAVAFFALPTRVHERYLFPALALAAPLVLRSWRWALLYLGLSISFFVNIYWVYTADWSPYSADVINPGVNGQPMTRDPLMAQLLSTPLFLQLVSAMIVVITVLLAWRAIRDAVRPAPSREAVGSEVVGARAAASAPVDAETPLTRFRAWLRPDPADAYLREPMRRLDRLDLALVAGLIVLSFLFRLWRIDQPPSWCCFDEQYHARSATEFLADWEHGWTRDVYEWTHPMLAKYLIAAGIVLADPNQVTDSAQLPDAPAALAVAPQRTAFSRPQSVLFSGSGRRITARDATTFDELASWEAAGNVASLAYDANEPADASEPDDPNDDRLLVGFADGGTVATYPLSAFLAHSGPRAPPPPGPGIETALGSVAEIVVPSRQSVILFRGSDGIAEVERATGAPLASSRLVAGGIGYVAGTGEEGVGSVVVVTDMKRGRVAILDGDTLKPITRNGRPRVEPLPAAPAGPLAIRGEGEDQQVYVPVGALPADIEHPDVEGGLTVFDNGIRLIDTVPLPGAAKLIGWQPITNMIYVLGEDTEAGQPAAWTVQTLGNGDPQSAGFAAFDTTLLPGEPQALAFDATNHNQSDDHGLLLVSTGPSEGSGGSAALVAIDTGTNVVAWRLGGIVFGSVLAALVYLLAATMFSRRRIAVLAGLFIAFDAMSYVMSRISMNDIYVATFIVAAYLVFWQVWSGRWGRSAWWALPLVGVLIGLATATKWVGLYALIGIWVLVLGRSALGRFLLVAAAALIAVVGGIGAPWPFSLICLGALVLALVLVWARPIRLDLDDLIGGATTVVVAAGIGLAFALALGEANEAGSVVELVFALLAHGAQAGWPAWIMLGVAALLLVWRAVLSLRNPESDRRWYQPDSMGGLAWSWVGACLAVVPLLVYFLSYVPYLQLGHNIAGPDAGPGYGWSLEELQAQAFGYHFGLTAGHVASSPWWSWPLDLKPVWFYGSGNELDGRQIAMEYNGGNPILFWAGVPAIIWCGIQAWRRRSPALVLIVAAFAFQFLPWARIERATFQYHYLTALPFAMLAVAYVVDEMLRSWDYRPVAISFLTLAVIAGVLIFPLGSTLPMPDWYINQARALPPWNYAFQFPSPPTGSRSEQLQFPMTLLVAGGLAALAAAAFALRGRDLLAIPALERDDQQDDSQDDERDRPQQVGVQPGYEFAEQEPGADPDQDEPHDHRSGP